MISVPRCVHKPLAVFSASLRFNQTDSTLVLKAGNRTSGNYMGNEGRLWKNSLPMV